MIKKSEKGSKNTEKCGSGGLEEYLIKFGRFCAWALLVFVILYFISGFGMTKSGLIYKWTGGIMDRALSLQIHNWLVLPMAFASICHVLIAVRFAMIRWQVKNMKVLNWVFTGIGVLLFILVLLAYAA